MLKSSDSSSSSGISFPVSLSQHLPALSHRKVDMLVIGGGVIGMATAYELAKKGREVTVIDQGDMGFGCSYGNAGWLTPCFSMPLPMPGMIMKSIKWLLDPESPLYIKPSPSPLLAQWLWRFLRSMNEKDMLRSVAALTQLSSESLRAYSQWSDDWKNPFSFQQKGLLMVSQTDEGFRATQKEMELVAAHGIPGTLLNSDEVRTMEPAITGSLKGGVYFPKEAHLEPLAVVRTLASKIEEMGGELLPRTEVFDFSSDPSGHAIVRTTHGSIEANQIIIATGSWSYSMGKALGLNIPILGGKGYSLIMKPFDPAPTTPIMLLERKIAVTPRNGSIRIAGTLELVDRDFSITKRRVQAIIKGAQAFMNVPAQPEIVEVWRGLRPCTPDGLPLIGRAGNYKNIVLATGHQLLGLQTAPASGRLTAEIALHESPSFDPKPFSPERFQ